MTDPEIERLWQTVRDIERNVLILRTALAEIRERDQEPAAQARQTQAILTPARETPVPVPALLPKRAPSRSPLEIENLIGGRGLLYLGALLVVIGVASFLKIAFDREWIGPAMRVALGIVGGAGVIAGATIARRRVAPYFADTLVGIGAAIEYVSFFSAGALFHVMSLGEITAGMIAVTAAVALLAYRGNRQPLAYVALVGGLITPLLTAAPQPDTVLLFVYLSVLSAFSVALGELRNWRYVPVVSLAGSVSYWLVVGLPDTSGHPIGVRLGIAVVLYAIFAATAVIAWRRGETLDPLRLGVVIGNGVWFFVSISALAAHDRVPLAATLLLVSAGHVLLSRLTQQRQQLWLATVALGFAIPPLAYAFAGVAPDVVVRTALHLGWIALGTGALVVGLRANDRVLAVLGALLYAGVAISLAAGDTSQVDTLILNDRFISLCALIAGANVVMRSWKSSKIALSSQALIYLEIGLDAIALIAISPEAWHLGELLVPAMGGQAGAAGISVAWAIYGASLVVRGVRSGKTSQRWAGLGLLGATAIKVFLYDLVGLDIVFRVLSALVLGCVFLTIAFLYQRRLAREVKSPASDANT